MREVFLRDFEYLYSALKAHPLFFRENKSKDFQNYYAELQDKIKDESSLIDAMTALTMFFEDGHTNIELPYLWEDKCLKIVCEWQDERLFLKEAYENIEEGAEIVAIEGMTLKWLTKQAASVIPHENIYLVKSRMIEYPYKNYHIFSKKNLNRLFGHKESYEITFQVDGKVQSKQCKLINYDGYLDFQEDNLIRIEEKSNTIVLHLDGCICNELYKITLKQIALLCEEKGIGQLELDLSKNMGGSSAVIDEFIKYVDIEHYRRYEMIDYSSGEPQYITRREDIVTNKRKEVLFPKNIICRVSNTTFSSARTFAVTLMDNGIAEIVGQPTGGMPNSYGMPRKDITPNLGIRFRVSRCLFLRPDAEAKGEALFPTIML